MTYEDNPPEEKTEVIYGAENIISATLEQWSKLRHYADMCIDFYGPSMFVIPNHPITFAYRKLKERGIRLRVISEINKDNIQYCKELMRTCELRHLDEVKGNFGLGDGLYYRASAKTTELSPPPLLISSTLRALVEQQQYFFDMLWRKAIPVKKRIKEIEEGLKREFIETLQEPNETLELIPKMMSAATEEILLVFSDRKILTLFENEIEITKLLREQLNEGNHIQVLIHGNVSTGETNSIYVDNNFNKLSEEHPNQFELQYITSNIYDRLNVFIVDRETVIIVESNKSTKNTVESEDDQTELLGLATYSNSESTVSSYATIFERLWIKSEVASSK